MPLFPAHHHKTKTGRGARPGRILPMTQITPRRPGGKYFLTDHRFQYLKSIGSRDDRGRPRLFSVRVYKVGRLSIGGWR
jgi:hypothetical protein